MSWLPALDGAGIAVLLVAVVLAGLVRGFAGFGTAMVFVPLASRVLDPVQILMAIAVFDTIGVLPLLPSMAKSSSRTELSRLGIGAFVGIPLGLFILTSLDTDNFRIVVSGLIFVLVILLLSGWRYSGTLGPKTTTGIGFAGGLMGGFAGIPGPPVIMTYLSSKRPANEIRANIFVYLFITEVFLIATLALRGLLALPALTLGLVLTLPYFAAEVIGARLFDPSRERLFRGVAYTIILASAIVGLPFWD